MGTCLKLGVDDPGLVIQVWSQLLALSQRVVQSLLNQAFFMVHLKVLQSKDGCPGCGFPCLNYYPKKKMLLWKVKV